jgi:hypothetical protein
VKLETPYKVVGNIDLSLTNAIVEKIDASDWLVYDYSQSMGFKNCKYILLRHSSEYSSNTIKDMPLMGKFKNELNNVLKHLENFYDFTEHVSFMAMLEPHCKIHMHQDNCEFLEKIHRIHIPLKTNSDCFYAVDNSKINMQVGTIYEIDNTHIHGVTNDGDTCRIHLLINLYPRR